MFGLGGPRRVLVCLLAVVGLVAVSACAGGIERPEQLRKAVTVVGIREHQQALQQIADEHAGNRMSGMQGYEASVDYVMQRLEKAGYEPSEFEFEFVFVTDRTPPVLERVTAPAQTFTEGTEFVTLDYSGSGHVTAEVVAIDLLIPSPAANTSTSGCEPADFAGFPAGAVALIQRGTCTFRVKTDNAVAAGAVGVIVFNEGIPDRTGVLAGTLGEPPASLPVVGTTFALGEGLRNGVVNGPTGVNVRLRTDTIVEPRTTGNVIAETPGGDPGHVVVVGAHLDSVRRGPGIQDNGSGAATILEIAEVMGQRQADTTNKVRFMWYGAEELGLIGSTRYVESLPQAERDRIELMLNFDMIGSPNFVRFVYDGNNSSFPVGPGVQPGPAGSGAIEQVFLDYFASQQLAVQPTPFDGRSDYRPFIEAGIPAGGLFSGAEGIKTAQQAAVYGGTAGTAYDPCYHLACDTFDNISLTALDQLSDAAAHTMFTFAVRDFGADPLTDPPTTAERRAGDGGRLREDPHHPASSPPTTIQPPSRA
jgi:Zn-dependent M28 family amino/carboxypeptidase